MEELVLSFPLEKSRLQSYLIFASAAILSFFAPFTLGHPQWLVGTIINACLFAAAVYLPRKYFILLAVLPSLGVLARGAIFGPQTLFLVYFLPFVWLGNLLLILSFKSLSAKTGFIFSVITASTVKFLFLFIVAAIYLKFSIVPAIFLQAMGFNQLATALSGGMIAFLIFKIWKK